MKGNTDHSLTLSMDTVSGQQSSLKTIADKYQLSSENAPGQNGEQDFILIGDKNNLEKFVDEWYGQTQNKPDEVQKYKSKIRQYSGSGSTGNL